MKNARNPIIPDLEGKIVLITGASSGIGASCARAFGRAGCRVALHYYAGRNQAEEVAADVRLAGGDTHLVCGDLRQTSDARNVVDETITRFGAIDILINNAGGLVKRVPAAQYDDELLDEVINLNIRSVVSLSSAAIPHMQHAGRGNIINVTSVAVHTGGGSGAALYASAKGFVATLTRGLAHELVKDNIRVNAVAPGVIMTPFHQRYSTPQLLEDFIAKIPMARIGVPEEVAGAFLYLASDTLSGFVTGQTLEVNGGQVMV